jgi:hypothetical protein
MDTKETALQMRRRGEMTFIKQMLTNDNRRSRLGDWIVLCRQNKTIAKI